MWSLFAPRISLLSKAFFHKTLSDNHGVTTHKIWEGSIKLFMYKVQKMSGGNSISMNIIHTERNNDGHHEIGNYDNKRLINQYLIISIFHLFFYKHEQSKMSR